MLPDYPEVKKLLMRRLMKVMAQSRELSLGGLTEIDCSIVHEGGTDVMVRDDGTVEEINFKRVQVESFIKSDSGDIEQLKLEQVINCMVESGQRIADQQAKLIWDGIEKAVREVGNFIGPNVNPAEQFLEMVGKRSIEFDRAGQPILGMLYVHDEKDGQKILNTMKLIYSTPGLKQRFDVLIEQKRREFLDREAARKLVD